MRKLIDEITSDEGFEGNPYKDSLGIDTIGIGTKLPLDEDEAKLILEHRLNKKIDHLLNAKPIVITLPLDKQQVLFGLSYQLGVTGLLKFKRMWLAIESGLWNEAAAELLDSTYATQTPNRAYRYADRLKA